MHSLNKILWYQLRARALQRGKLNEVLLAMGISEKQIEGSIRISMGQMTTQKDIDSFKEKFEMIYEEVKELLK